MKSVYLLPLFVSKIGSAYIFNILAVKDDLTSSVVGSVTMTNKKRSHYHWASTLVELQNFNTYKVLDDVYNEIIAMEQLM